MDVYRQRLLYAQRQLELYVYYSCNCKGNMLVNSSHIEIFFTYLDTVCFMHGMSIYEIKTICYRAQPFILSHGSFQRLILLIPRSHS